MLETLARAYPQFVPRDCIAWESYLWAVECWYAYAIQVGHLRLRAALFNGQ